MDCTMVHWKRARMCWHMSLPALGPSRKAGPCSHLLGYSGVGVSLGHHGSGRTRGAEQLIRRGCHHVCRYGGKQEPDWGHNESEHSNGVLPTTFIGRFQARRLPTSLEEAPTVNLHLRSTPVLYSDELGPSIIKHRRGAMHISRLVLPFPPSSSHSWLPFHYGMYETFPENIWSDPLCTIF